MPLPERQLISRIQQQARRLKLRKSALVAGIGDDCAILRIPPGQETLVTTDFSLEGIHFRREWHPPKSIGHRCLTRGLSDIAAVGGTPLAAFLSLAIPTNVSQNWVDSFCEGLLELAKQFNVPLAGGDTAESPRGILADIVVVGSVPKGTGVLRSGARPGDRIYVTGELGGSAATLGLLFANPKKKLVPRLFPSHFFPTSRIDVGRILREKRIATAMIDISDGLSTDLSHICDESRVGAQISADALPRATVAHQTVNLQIALHGGEAYELLFTANPATRVPAQIAGVKITAIGEVKRGKKLSLVRADHTRSELKPRGWQHFQ